MQSVTPEPTILSSGIGNGYYYSSEFQPGSDVIFYALVNNGTTPVAGYSVDIKILNDEYVEVFNTTATTNQQGFVSYTHTIPADWDSGAYDVYFYAGQNSGWTSMSVSDVSFVSEAAYAQAPAENEVSIPLLVETSHGSRSPYTGSLSLNFSGSEESINVVNGLYIFNTTLEPYTSESIYVDNIDAGYVYASSETTSTYVLPGSYIQSDGGDTIEYIILLYKTVNSTSIPLSNKEINIQGSYYDPINYSEVTVMDENLQTDSSGFARFNYTVPDISETSISFSIYHEQNYVGYFSISLYGSGSEAESYYSTDISTESYQILAGDSLDVTMQFEYCTSYYDCTGISGQDIIFYVPYLGTAYSGTTDANGNWTKTIQIPSTPVVNSYALMAYTTYNNTLYTTSYSVAAGYSISPNVTSTPSTLGGNAQIRFETKNPSTHGLLPSKQVFGALKYSSGSKTSYAEAFSGTTNANGILTYQVPLSEYGSYMLEAYSLTSGWTSKSFDFYKYMVDLTLEDSYTSGTSISIPVAVTNRETSSGVQNVGIEAVISYVYMDPTTYTNPIYPTGSCTTDTGGTCTLSIDVPAIASNNHYPYLYLLFSDGDQMGVVESDHFTIYASGATTTTTIVGTTSTSTTTTLPTGETTCSSCSGCSAKLNGDYDTVKLTADIADHDGTCVLIDASNVEFDCQGHTIDGDGDNSGYGAYMHLETGNTIKNCIFTGFKYGVYLSSSSLNTLNSNRACSNTESDFYLSESPVNYGDGNTCDNPDGWNDEGDSGCTYDCSAVTTTSTTTTIEGECSLEGDTPPCGEVELSEVIDFITEWVAGNATLSDVIKLINAWAG